jgi:large repetitive protein
MSSRCLLTVACAGLAVTVGAPAGWAQMPGHLVGPVSGQSVSCGQVITADTRLENDLLDCPEVGLVIGADGITVDLNGHMLDGDARQSGEEATDYGIDNTPGHIGVEVRNGTIREFDYGIRLGASFAGSERTGNSFQRLLVTRNATGIELLGSHDNLVQHNRLSGNGFGLAVYSSDRNRIARNVLAANYSALSLERAERNTVTHNQVSKSSFGIGLFIAHSNLIERNTVRDTVGPNDFTDAAGIALFDSDRNTLSRNVLLGNRFGVLLTSFAVTQSSDSNTVKANTAADNRQDGIRISGTLGVNPGNPRSNVLVRNTTDRNAGDGIRIDDDSPATLLWRNRASHNADDGIDVDHPQTSLHRNQAVENGDLGIEAVAGIGDLGGNRANLNGNPLQCLNVFCQ